MLCVLQPKANAEKEPKFCKQSESCCLCVNSSFRFSREDRFCTVWVNGTRQSKTLVQKSYHYQDLLLNLKTLKKKILQTLSQYSCWLLSLGLLLGYLFASQKPNKKWKGLQTKNVSRLIRACTCDSMYVLPVEIPY